jgi:hypothetical protein
MPRTLVLPTLAALTIAGAAIGVQVGRSTVDDINPFWFTPHEQDGFFGDLTAVKTSYDAPPPTVSTAEVPITSCVGCLAWSPTDRAQYATAWVEAPPPQPRTRTRAEPDVVYEYVIAEEAPDPDREAVVRYAGYPVSADDAAAAEEEEADEPELAVTH